MATVDSKTIRPTELLFAPVSPPTKNGTRWIDYSSCRYTARDARRESGQYWPGGWDDLKKRGWRIARVRVVPFEAPSITKAPSHV